MSTMTLFLLSLNLHKGWKCYFHSSRTKPRGHRDHFWRSSNSGGFLINLNTSTCFPVMNSSSSLSLFILPFLLFLCLSCFSACSCLVIPDLSSDSCGLHSSEWLLLLTSKQCSLSHYVFTWNICFWAPGNKQQMCPLLWKAIVFSWQDSYVVWGHHL